MANHLSAKKSIRKTIKQTLVKRTRMSRVRTYIKKVYQAVASGDKTIAASALTVVQSEIMRAASKGVIKLNAASRKISRLSQKVKQMV